MKKDEKGAEELPVEFQEVMLLMIELCLVKFSLCLDWREGSCSVQ